jgi:branched-chain amino acid transport system ATP-binding protein
VNALLDVEGLTAGYGAIQVLHGLDFTVAEGEIVVILGANGAGKTTTMRAISATIAHRGAVRFKGAPLPGKPDAALRAGISQVPQGRGTFTDLTVEDNLLAGAYSRGGASVREDVDRWFTQFPRLAERKSQKAGSLSGGEQQMLAIARAMMSRPVLLLCDEPSLGLAPIITQELFKLIGQLREESGMAVLLVEQNANLALKLADRAYVLETGRIVATGTGEQLLGDDTIKQAYLGVA